MTVLNYCFFNLGTLVEMSISSISTHRVVSSASPYHGRGLTISAPYRRNMQELMFP